MSDEGQLIEAARAGSVPAFTALVAAYRVRLLRFLLTRCPSHADAEDVLQDTLLNAYRYLDSYDPRWRFSTWLYRIAIRNAAKLKAPARSPDSGLADLETDTDVDPLRQCIAASERENLWLTARRVLNEDVCTALWLRYVEDMSIRDVATALDRSTAWTKVNLMRARDTLDVALKGEAGEQRSKVYGRI